jgi:Helicase conserved C-terminal domain
MVIKDSDGQEFTRKELVLALCNKEGGAHVDPEIEAAYEKLASSNSLGWVYREGDGPDQLLPNPVVYSMRQISHEVLESVQQQRDRLNDLHRIISFHSYVNRARDFAAEMPDVLAWMPARQRPKGALRSRHASGEMSAGERHVLLQHLSRLDDGERGLLTNARCLSEGVDVPTLDGVAFVDPRRSEVDIVQAVGRAIRKSEDKNVGTLVIPVFIDTDEDPEIALDSSVFKPVWDVIKAHRAHDEDLGEQLDELRRAMGKKGSRPRLPDKIHVDVPAKVGADFARAFGVRLVEQTTTSWEFWFGLLEKYVAENGTARVLGQTATFHGQLLCCLDNTGRHGVGRALLLQHPDIDQNPQRITRCVTSHPTRCGDLGRLAVANVHQIEDVGRTARQAVAQPDIVEWINAQPL